MNTLLSSPSFDTWTIIFAVVALQGLAVAVWQWRQCRSRQPASVYLALLSLLFSVTLIEYVFYWTKYLLFFPHLISISAGFPLLMGPLVYFYTREVLIEQRWKTADVLHLFPFLLFLAFRFHFYILPAAEKLNYINNTAQPAWYAWLPWIKAVIMLGYCGVSYRLIRIAPSGLPDTKTWTRCVLGAFTGYILSYLSYFILSGFSWFNTEWDYMISFAMSGFIYIIAYLGYIQPRVFSGQPLIKAILPAEKYRHSPLDSSFAAEISARLEKLMREECLYQDGDLRLEVLADRLGISRHILSQVLNEHLQQNFSSYLNTYRIENAKKLLKERNGHSVIKEIYFEVGFNNKVTFLNAFKKHTGCTPSQFARQETGKVLSD